MGICSLSRLSSLHHSASSYSLTSALLMYLQRRVKHATGTLWECALLQGYLFASLQMDYFEHEIDFDGGGAVQRERISGISRNKSKKTVPKLWRGVKVLRFRLADAIDNTYTSAGIAAECAADDAARDLPRSQRPRRRSG